MNIKQKKKFSIDNNNIFNMKKKIMGICLKFIHKVYISYIKHIDKTIEIKYITPSFIIKKDLKNIFNDYKEKYINKKVNLVQNNVILEKIKKFFEIKSSDLLKISTKFPFKNKITSVTSVEIDENIKNIIKNESENINLENKYGIFLDELTPEENIERHKSISNSYFKIILDNGDDYLYKQLLNQNCYEIINVCFFQAQKTTYEKLYQCSVVEEQNTSKLILIPNNSQTTQTFNPKKLLLKEKNDENESTQKFLNKKKGKDINFSIEKEKKEIVVNSNNQEVPQNISENLTFKNKYVLSKEKHGENESSQNFLINSFNHLNSDNINIFSENTSNYSGNEKEKNNIFFDNQESNIENMSTRYNTTENDYFENFDEIDNSEFLVNANNVDPPLTNEEILKMISGQYIFIKN